MDNFDVLLIFSLLVVAGLTAYFISPLTYNVRAFGALGDGATDDTAAFERAFLVASWAPSPFGSRLVVPDGVYPVSRPLWVPNGVKIRGIGPRAVIKVVGQLPGEPAIVGDHAGVRWYGVRLTALRGGRR